MEPLARIQAESRQQAMDWSLVLLSQGIESQIEASEDPHGWWLEVAEHEYRRAVESIQKYQQENRRWMWRRELAIPGLLFDWAAVSWLVLIIVFFWASSESPVLKEVGAMDTSKAAQGEWWRFCTAIWLHADSAHLASNASIGVVLLGLTLGLYGTGLGMLAACLSGIGGNLVAWMLAAEPHRSLGASGLVMGCIGLLAAQSLLGRSPNRLKLFITSLGGALMLFVLLGLSPGTDVMAHSGGALSGLILGLVLVTARPRVESATLNLTAGAAFCLLTLVPWTVAVLNRL